MVEKFKAAVEFELSQQGQKAAIRAAHPCARYQKTSLYLPIDVLDHCDIDSDGQVRASCRSGWETWEWTVPNPAEDSDWKSYAFDAVPEPEQVAAFLRNRAAHREAVAREAREKAAVEQDDRMAKAARSITHKWRAGEVDAYEAGALFADEISSL